MTRLRFYLSSYLITGAIFAGAAMAADTPQAQTQKAYDAIVDAAPGPIDGFTKAQRDDLFDKVSHHPVASLSVIGKYDHQATGIGNGEIGFCYGRAMTTHLVARHLGLAATSIKKIFIAGDLNNGAGIRWRFHMATLVKGDDQRWYVIDPIMPSLGKPGVIEPYEWMKAVKDRFDLPDGKDQSHFYTTDTQSIMVDMRVVPGLPELEVQDRLIEPSFEPEGRVGFEKVRLQDESDGPYPVHRVTGDAQARYFIMRDEPALNGKEVNDFDFYSLPIVILYKFPTEALPTFITRAYNYNNYFEDLVKSIGAPPAPVADENAVGFAAPLGGAKLFGFSQPLI